MTLDETIKRLRNLAIHHRDDTFPENAQAINMGIEAIERERKYRKNHPDVAPWLLQGETEE